ncbi:hypothetical protein [Stenotrophomonas sp. YIM B06876]|uniref:hypothetical protein n=1 Tax=Stenotrophomonas sp. YIM B06876 TaxID=3060211 RepID=UPI002739DBC5|nr:hypothetical protein [Stenotrophomonas sp. YIM B06876]
MELRHTEKRAPTVGARLASQIEDGFQAGRLRGVCVVAAAHGHRVRAATGNPAWLPGAAPMYLPGEA